MNVIYVMIIFWINGIFILIILKKNKILQNLIVIVLKMIKYNKVWKNKMNILSVKIKKKMNW